MRERSEEGDGHGPSDEVIQADLRCFGCGLEPEEGRVHRLADGSACPTCASRLVEAQPGLLPAQPVVADGAVPGASAGEALDVPEPVHAAVGDLPTTVGRRVGQERFQLLRGAGPVAEGSGDVPILDPGPPEPA